MDSYTFTGRAKKPLSKKLNPIWWFQNDDEQTVAEAPWYEPKWPYWRRWLWWNVVRNPLQNARAYVLGVQDRNYTVVGRAPVLTVQRNDLSPPQDGLQWCIIKLPVPRPFLSWSFRGSVFYLGWQPTGFCGAKFTGVFAWVFWGAVGALVLKALL